MQAERVGDRRGALGDPDGEHERETGPTLPLGAKIVDVLVVLAVGLRDRVILALEHEGSIANHEPRGKVAVPVAAGDRVGLGITRNKDRLRAPDVLEEQLQQVHAGHRRAAHEHALPREFRRGERGEEHHASHRAVARNREVRKEEIALLVARILYGRDDAHIQRPLGHHPVQRGGDAIHQCRVQWDEAPVYPAVHGKAVDVGDASDAHQAAPWIGSARPVIIGGGGGAASISLKSVRRIL